MRAKFLATLTIRRTFNATRERVFAAFTTPALLQAWFGPPGTTIGDVEFDARPGGRYRIPMRLRGDQYYVVGVINDIEPPERLAYSFRWEINGPQLDSATNVRIEFIARGEQTDMILTQENFSSEESWASHANGWGQSLEKLASEFTGTRRLK